MSGKQNKVNLFIPCCMDMFISESPNAVISVLEKLGDECVYNPEQTCCGRDFYMRGDIDSARDLGFRLIGYFDNPYKIVVPSAACVGYIKTYFNTLFESGSFAAPLKHTVQDIYELCDYIVNEKGVSKLENSFKHKVFYFQSCAARNLYKSGDEAETLLLNTDGLELVTDPDLKVCCSANGDLALHNHELSEYMLKMIVDKIQQTDAEYITSTDVHCLQYIDAYLCAHPDIQLDVIPIAEIFNAHEA